MTGALQIISVGVYIILSLLPIIAVRRQA